MLANDDLVFFLVPWEKGAGNREWFDFETYRHHRFPGVFNLDVSAEAASGGHLSNVQRLDLWLIGK